MGSIYAILPGVIEPLFKLLYAVDNIVIGSAGSVDGILGVVPLV